MRSDLVAQSANSPLKAARMHWIISIEVIAVDVKSGIKEGWIFVDQLEIWTKELELTKCIAVGLQCENVL